MPFDFSMLNKKQLRCRYIYNGAMRRLITFIVTILIVFVAYSGLYAFDISSKTEYWQQKIDSELPVGSDFKRFEAWVKANHLTFRKNTGVESYYASTESSLPYPVCQRWVDIRFDFDSNHKISNAYSTAQIVCW